MGPPVPRIKGTELGQAQLSLAMNTWPDRVRGNEHHPVDDHSSLRGISSMMIVIDSCIAIMGVHSHPGGAKYIVTESLTRGAVAAM